jgi:hypothetical protein
LFASNYPCHLLLNFASLVLLGKAGKNWAELSPDTEVSKISDLLQSCKMLFQTFMNKLLIWDGAASSLKTVLSASVLSDTESFIMSRYTVEPNSRCCHSGVERGLLNKYVWKDEN